MNPEQEKRLVKNSTGYAFVVMFALIIVVVNPLIIVIPVTIIYTRKAYKYIRNYDWIYRTGRMW